MRPATHVGSGGGGAPTTSSGAPHRSEQQGLKLKRVLSVWLVFVLASLLHIVSNKGGDLAFQTIQQLASYDTEISTEDAIRNRLGYVRLPDDGSELLGIFETLSEPDVIAKQPKTPREIAERYGLHETSRNVKCHENTTTKIGWIPAHNSTGDTVTYQGQIPRFVFQSWKSNELTGRVCDLIVSWSVLNPEYDYFLFDDDAVDRFITLEYGHEIFSSYACVKVGAAKCDVWRLLVMYIFGGTYFDADVRQLEPFRTWDWGDRDVVTSRSCTAARKKHPGGCAHQWAMIYTPRHPVIYAAVRETIYNLAIRTATNVYDVSFWSYYHAWRNGPYNQSYMPRWGESMGGRVLFQDDDAKNDMVDANGYWQNKKQIWYDECLPAKYNGNTSSNA